MTNTLTSEVIGYGCKYTPIELLESFGLTPVMLEGQVADFGDAETATHANLCSHAKALLQLSDDQSQILLCDCCDSFRRVYDVLDYRGNHTYLKLLDLPHENTGCAKEQFGRTLLRLVHELEELTGRPFSGEDFKDACKSIRKRQQDHALGVLSSIQEPFLAVVGARVAPELLDQMQSHVDLPIVNLTCNGYRLLDDVPDDIENWSVDATMEWYADALLSMVPCMRMIDVASRRQLTEHPHLAGIIYNTIKFCDFYPFDYATLVAESSCPILKIESDYTPTPAGQLATRLEAFQETLQPEQSSGEAMAPQSTPHGTPSSDAAYVAGIDSGSTSTNMVVLDKDGTVVASAIVRTGAKAQNGAREAFQNVKDALGAQDADFSVITATGYGRDNIDFADFAKTEITCHAKGAHALNPSIRTIVDIGGQDSKVIVLDEDGGVVNFAMNDKCAAGTGRFLEAMARTLELDLPTLSARGLSWKKDLTISSMCTVFAESEVISLIADNHSDEDIIHGLNKSVASRTAAMVSRVKGEGPYMMTGGVARNQGVVNELSDKLSADLFVAQDPDLCGAYGAALFALEAHKSSSNKGLK